MASLSIVENKLSFSGTINFQTVNSLEVKGVFFIKYCNFKTIIVDLSGITMADSSVLALMLSWYREAIKMEMGIIFEHGSASLLKLAKLCQVDEILKL